MKIAKAEVKTKTCGWKEKAQIKRKPKLSIHSGVIQDRVYPRRLEICAVIIRAVTSQSSTCAKQGSIMANPCSLQNTCSCIYQNKMYMFTESKAQGHQSWKLEYWRHIGCTAMMLDILWGLSPDQDLFRINEGQSHGSWKPGWQQSGWIINQDKSRIN